MFSVISENLQPFDKRTQEVFQLNEEAFKLFVRNVEKAGAKYIDVNPGPLKRNKEKLIKFLVEGIEKYSELNILIDSTDPETIEIALMHSIRKPVINGFSFEEKKIRNILPLSAKFNADIIGLVMTETHIPTSTDEKIALAEKMIMEAEKLGIPKSRIILDPVILPLGWQDGALCAKENLEFIKHLPEIFGSEIRTAVGLSNLTTRAAGGKDKGFLQSLYLSALYQAGADMVMLDTFNAQLQKTVKFLETLEGKRVFSFAEFLS
jgi:cobalamin-dependent methionine synthase I